MKASSRVLPHINDLLAVRPDTNPHAPIRKVLLEAENYSKQADTHIDFRRPDLALQEFIKAYTIAVDIIPRHKDYPSLRLDHADLSRTWSALQKRIMVQVPQFEEVKRLIKADNAQSGVLPVSRHALSAPLSGNGATNGSSAETAVNEGMSSNSSNPSNSNSVSDGNDNQNGAANSPTPLTSRKQPPPIHPKPNGLHGKIVKTQVTNGQKTHSPVNEDLAARFARLRGPDSPSIAQDPRIKTQSVMHPDQTISPTTTFTSLSHSMNGQSPKIAGPRDMPTVPRGPPRPLKLPLDLQIPSMPRPPDAVYSPARGINNYTSLESTENTPRHMYGPPLRTNSVNSVNGGTRVSTSSENKPDYFSIPKVSGGAANTMPSTKNIDVGTASSSHITAQELMRLLQRGSSELRILLVDLRDRDQFDAGHIMAQNVLCVEPIVLRKDMSADELAQSMVLSPEVEQRHYDERQQFDLLVYYDQSSLSEEDGASVTSSDENALRNFRKAVDEYSYDKKLKRRPMLLVGGLDAWIDLVGVNALLASTSGRLANRPRAVPGQDAAALGMTRSRATRKPPGTRRRTYESRPLTKEEETLWDQTLKDEAVPSPSIHRDGFPESWSYNKTTEDFFRRFPEVSIQESMISPRKADPAPLKRGEPFVLEAQHDEELNSLMPKAPTRPSPALPRPSYSGVSDKGVNHTGNNESSRPVDIDGPNSLPVVATISQTLGVKGRTGLQNFGNTCYMNSVLQCLNATTGLAHYLMSGSFEEEKVKPRRRNGESSDPPQLMTRNLANLLRHLWSGQYTYVTPKTFRNYVRAVHSRDRAARYTFGGNDQQDASEFLTFVLEMLDDEMNFRRHVAKGAEPTSSEMAMLVKMPPVQSATKEWGRFFQYEASPINGIFGGQYTTTLTCNSCGHTTKRWDTWQNLALSISKTRRETLLDVLRSHFKPETIEDYKCDECTQKGAVRSMYLSRCPPVIIIDLKRPLLGEKLLTEVTFPLDKLDLRPYFVGLEGMDLARLPKEYVPPFTYDCYAIIQHQGNTVNSGHYWALIRDPSDPTVWWRMNDDSFSKVPAHMTQTNQSYILFYKRSRG